MALNKYIIGDLIEQTSLTNSSLFYSEKDVKGMTIDKRVIPTKAKIVKADLKNFLVIQPNEFIYNPRTHGKRIGLGFNNTNENFIISWNNIGFRIKSDKRDVISPTYLYMYLNRLEWDRNACFMSWGSSTEVFSWKEFTKMKIELPPLEIQKKYTKIYENLINMKNENQRLLCNLKIMCDTSIEELRKKYESQKIGNYLEQTNVRCGENKLIKMMGISNDHTFKKPNSRTRGVDISKYKIVYPNEFGWSPIHINNGSIALNKSNTPYAISPIYSSFKTESEKLYPDYLFMFFKRSEFVRYCWYYAYGSARDAIQWDSIAEVRIPIPDLSTQKLIATFSEAYEQRRAINDKINMEIQQICPILIRGSQLEANKIND